MNPHSHYVILHLVAPLRLQTFIAPVLLKAHQLGKILLGSAGYPLRAIIQLVPCTAFAKVSCKSVHQLSATINNLLVANHIGGQSGSSPSAGATSLPPTNQRGRSNSQSSPTHSRATSPLRLFQWSLHRAHSREDPFVAVDPFKWHFRICNIPPGQPKPDEEQASCVAPLSCCFPSSTTKSSPQVDTLFSNSRSFLFDTFPRQLYLNCLLRLPSLYFSRVARVFEDAEVSKGDMQRIIDSARGKSIGGQTVDPGGRAGGTAAPQNTSEVGVTLPFPNDWVPPAVSVPLARFKHSWEDFIDSLMREWKTLNLVSALLCSYVMHRLLLNFLDFTSGQSCQCSKSKKWQMIQ